MTSFDRPDCLPKKSSTTSKVSEKLSMNQPVNLSNRPRFSTVAYGRYQVERLSPAEIDELLAHGWFRSDLNVTASVSRFVEQEWKPCVMLRSPLAGFVWKKRMRKLLRRNDREFEVIVQPFLPAPSWSSSGSVSKPRCTSGATCPTWRTTCSGGFRLPIFIPGK